MTRVQVFSEDLRLAAELVATATAIADEVHVVCLGAEAASTLAAIPVTSVIALDGETQRPEAYVAELARLTDERGADLLLIGSTVSGWEMAARVAAILGVGLVTDATELTAMPDGAWRAERVVYAGAAVQTECWTGPAVVTIAGPPAVATAQPARTTPVGTGPVETVTVRPDTRVLTTARLPRERGTVDLAGAGRVVCVGMGLDAIEDLAVVQELAAALGAEVACTRPVAEDRGWLPTERSIGISGVSVHPDLYIGLGVSGQVQHTVGIRGARVVVGVNNDPRAPLFAVCDYAVVGDAHEIAPLLAAAVRARGRAGMERGR